jgi:hypothetical protein
MQKTLNTHIFKRRELCYLNNIVIKAFLGIIQHDIFIKQKSKMCEMCCIKLFSPFTENEISHRFSEPEVAKKGSGMVLLSLN